MKLRNIILSCLGVTWALFLCSGALASVGFRDFDARVETDFANNPSLDPRIAADNNGNVYVAWTDGRLGGNHVYFNRSTDNGDTWVDTDISLGTIASPETLNIGCDNTGHIYITWQNGGGAILARSDNFGENFTTIAMTSGISQEFDFAFNHDGHLAIVWNTVNNRELYAKYSLDRGTHWSSSKRLDTDPNHYWGDIHENPVICLDNNGNVYAAWVDNRGATGGERFIFFNRSTDHGETWQSEFVISSYLNGDVYQTPQIDCDNNGNVYAFFKKYRWPSDHWLFFRRSSNFGANWGDGQYVAGNAYNPRIQSTNNGRLYLAWNEDHDSWMKIRVKSSPDAGASWNPTATVAVNHNNQPGNFDFSIADTTVFVVWENNEPWQGIFANFSKDGGHSWQNRDIRVDTNPGEEGFITNRPAVALDADNNPLVVFEDGRNGQADIYCNKGNYALSLTEKIRLEADYILACQWLDPGPAYGAINNVYPGLPYPDYIVPRENGMAILGLILAYQFLEDPLYLERANLSMDYLVGIQDEDGAWHDKYEWDYPVTLSKSPTQTAEVMMAMYMLGYNAGRYASMKLGAEYLFSAQDNGYNGLVCGGKDADGNFSTWNWITDSGYSYWALLAARSWALVKGDDDFADECQYRADTIISAIDQYMYKGPEWWQVVDGNGNAFNNNGHIGWLNFAPRFLDLPVAGVENENLGHWMHNTFQQPDGGCIWGDEFPTQAYPGISFQSALAWMDLNQHPYADAGIQWSENSALWQLSPDQFGILGGWVDWIDIHDPSHRAEMWERYIDTSFYATASWLGGYDFSVIDNLPPQLNPIPNKNVRVHQPISFETSAEDPDSEDLYFSAENLPAGAHFNTETRVFTWTPSVTGTFFVRFKVSDGFLIDEKDVRIRVYRSGGGEPQILIMMPHDEEGHGWFR